LLYFMHIWYRSWKFGIFFPFWYFVRRKIWQPVVRFWGPGLQIFLDTLYKRVYVALCGLVRLRTSGYVVDTWYLYYTWYLYAVVGIFGVMKTYVEENLTPKTSKPWMNITDRVTRLGEFWPVGWLFTWASVSENYRSRPNVWATFFAEKVVY
jgi:hypothetical protein